MKLTSAATRLTYVFLAIKGTLGDLAFPCVAPGFLVVKGNSALANVYAGVDDGDISFHSAETDDEAYCSTVGCTGEQFSYTVPGRTVGPGQSAMQLNIDGSEVTTIKYMITCPSRSDTISFTGPGSEVCVDTSYSDGAFLSLDVAGCTDSIVTFEITCDEDVEGRFLFFFDWLFGLFEKPGRAPTSPNDRYSCRGDTPSGVFLIASDTDGYTYHGPDDGEIEVYMTGDSEEAGCSTELCAGEERVYGIPGRDDGAGGKTMTLVTGSDNGGIRHPIICPERNQVMTIALEDAVPLGSCSTAEASEVTNGGPSGIISASCTSAGSGIEGVRVEAEITCSPM